LVKAETVSGEVIETSIANFVFFTKTDAVFFI